MELVGSPGTMSENTITQQANPLWMVPVGLSRSTYLEIHAMSFLRIVADIARIAVPLVHVFQMTPFFVTALMM